MKMTDYKICCDKCLGDIGRVNPKAARLWMDLCRAYDVDDEYMVLSQDVPELRILEVLGYLISTEMQKNILVRLLGAQNHGIRKYFCSKVEHD